jgi:hypothetical protein
MKFQVSDEMTLANAAVFHYSLSQFVRFTPDNGAVFTSYTR